MQTSLAEYVDEYRLYRNFSIYAEDHMVQISEKILNALEQEIIANGFDLDEVKQLSVAPY